MAFDVISRRDHLGESPQWLPDSRRLVWIDMPAGLVHLLDPESGDREVLAFHPPIGFVVPRANGGLVVGEGMSVLLVERDGRSRTLVSIAARHEGERLNDAVCDAQGRLWVGTLVSPRKPGGARLLVIDGDGSVTEVLDGLTISNGMDWADGDLLHVDTPTGRVDRYRVDAESGALSGRSTVVQIEPEDGMPDGLTVDLDGGIWVALYGGGEVRRYRADGSLDGRVPLPITGVTSLMFGGSDLGDLYVTTARYKLTDAQVEAQPLAGAVLRLRPGVRGRPQYAFSG